MSHRTDPPKLPCPECGVPLIEAHGRGRTDSDGSTIWHRDGCRCAWCSWYWTDDADPVKCTCGAVVGVDCDDGVAVAMVVKP